MANRRDIDAGDAPCPTPLLLLIRAIDEVAPGDSVGLTSSQPGSARNIPAWVAKAGHTLESLEHGDGVFHYLVRKGH